MLPIELIIKGLIAGLAISAPVGPVNVLCISRVVSKGRRAGLIAGLGAACADCIYGAVAAFSISYVIYFLIRKEFWIRLVGGSLLIGIGVVYLTCPPKALDARNTESSDHSDFITAFLLNLTNPTTVLSFLAVLAVLHLGGYRGWSSLYLVIGIFAGCMAWWATLTVIAAHFSQRLDKRAMGLMNRIAGIAIGIFGIVMVILSRSTPK